MRKKPTPKKDSRTAREKLDEMERIECADWANDCRKRDRRQSDKYKEAGKLAERYRKKKK
jgi:hypothetical protein